jgi:hypothetical protein
MMTIAIKLAALRAINMLANTQKELKKEEEITIFQAHTPWSPCHSTPSQAA